MAKVANDSNCGLIDQTFTIGNLGQNGQEKLSDVHRKLYLKSNAKLFCGRLTFFLGLFG